MFITLYHPPWYYYFRNHFRQRLRERYKIHLGKKDYAHINAALKKDIPVVVSNDGKISMHNFRINGKFVYILFDQQRNIAKTCFIQTKESWNHLVNRRKKIG